VANWALTNNVQNFLASAGQGQNKDATVAVTATPAAAQVKGSDGADWVLACVLLDVRATITAEARLGYGYCERMQWHVGAETSAGGRWMIAPGAPAAVPDAYVDLALSVRPRCRGRWPRQSDEVGRRQQAHIHAASDEATTRVSDLLK